MAILWYTPTSFEPGIGDTGYEGFLEDLAATLNDPKDEDRPQFIDNPAFFGFAVLAGVPSGFQVDETFKAISDFTSSMTTKYKNPLETIVPQGDGYGVVQEDPKKPPALVLTVEEDLAPGVTIEAGKLFFANTGVVDMPRSRLLALPSNAACVIVAVEGIDDNGVKDYVYMAVEFGKGYYEEDSSTPAGYEYTDVATLIEYGLKTVFVGYVETNNMANVYRIDPNFRVLIPHPAEEKDKQENTQVDQQNYNWRGLSIRNMAEYDEIITWLNQGMRKIQPPSTMSSNLTSLGDLLSQLGDDLETMVKAMKETSKKLTNMVTALGSANFMLLMPWPTLVSGPDPYRLMPGDSFTLEADTLSATQGAPTGAQTIEFNAGHGFWEGTKSINFDIPAGSDFEMDLYLRRVAFDAGDALDTLGITGGSSPSQGVFVTGDARSFRIPNAGGEIILSTYGKGVQANAGAASVWNLLNMPTGVMEETSLKSLEAYQFHYPPGASITLSAWSNYLEVQPRPNNALPLLGWENTTFEEGVMTGSDSRKFNFRGGQAEVYTKNFSRDYLDSSLVTLTGFDSPQRASSTLDNGTPVPYFNFPADSGMKVSLAMSSLKILAGSAREMLGLLTPTEEAGSLVGDDSSTFTYLTNTFYLSSKSRLVSLTDTQVLQVLGWDAITQSDNQLVGVDSRLFSWVQNQGFIVEVYNGASLLYSGAVTMPVTDTARQPIVVANQVTSQLQAMPGAPPSAVCNYVDGQGTFNIYFGPSATSVVFIANPDPFDLLPTMGLTVGTQILSGGSLGGSEPESYEVYSSALSIKLGNEAFNLSIPLGFYTGTVLAAEIESLLQAQTGKSETVTYDISTGRFTLASDTSGYDWLSNVPVTVPARTLAPASDALVDLNSSFPVAGGNGTERFTYDGSKFVYFTQGIVSVTFSGTQDILDTYGLEVGTHPTPMGEYEGVEPARYWFNNFTNTLDVTLNGVTTTVTFPTNTPFRPTDINDAIETQVSTTSSVYTAGHFEVSTTSVLDLVNDLAIDYSGGTTGKSPVDVASNIQGLINAELLNNGHPASFICSYQDDRFYFSYPKMVELDFALPSSGDPLQNALGVVVGSAPISNGRYDGNPPLPYAVEAGDTFELILGTTTYSLTVPVTRYTGGDLKEALNTALQALPIITPPNFEFDSGSGVFSLFFNGDGFTQINGEIITLPAYSGLITGSFLASKIEEALLALLGATGNENVKFVSNKFIIFSDTFDSIRLENVGSSLSIARAMGYSPGVEYEAAEGRVIGSEPAFYYVNSTFSDFMIHNELNSYPVTLPLSSGYLLGNELAPLIQNAVQVATGLNETVNYNADLGAFNLVSDPTGTKIIDNQTVSLSGQSGYISDEALAVQFNAAIVTAIPSTTLRLEPTDSNRFKFAMPNMSQIEIASGASGVDLVGLAGFPTGVQLTPDNEFEGNNPNPFVISTFNQNVSVRLGSYTYTTTLTPASTPKSGLTVASELQAALQAVSGRATTVSYSPSTYLFTVHIDPAGEKLLQQESFTFGGGTFYNRAQVVSVMNDISTRPNAVGAEYFAQTGERFEFGDTSGTTITLEVLAPTPTYDLSGMLGLMPGFFSLSSDKILGSLPQYFIIVTGENDTLLNMDVNTDVFDLTLNAGNFTGIQMVSQLETLIGAETTELMDVSWDGSTGQFTVTSNDQGKLYTSNTYVFGAVSGDETVLASALQNLIVGQSPDGDETVGIGDTAFTLTKPDLWSVEFRNVATPVFADLLKVMGITPDASYAANALFTAIFEEWSPYYIGMGQDSFNLNLDGVSLDTVKLSDIGGALKGTEVAASMQKWIQQRLVSLGLADIFYASLFPNIPLLEDDYSQHYSVSRKVLSQIKDTVQQRIFNNFDPLIQDSLVQSFPDTTNIAEVPVINKVYEQIAPWGSSLQQIINDRIRSAQKAELGYVIEVSYPLTLSTLPYYLDPTDFNIVIRPIVLQALIDASLTIGVTLATRLLEETTDQLMVEYEKVFTEKYFYNAEVTYALSTSTFKIMSPTEGTKSGGVAFVAPADDVADHLGLVPGSEAPGTGDVEYIHLVRSFEVIKKVQDVGFEAMPWGQASLKPSHIASGEVQGADTYFPFRHYIPEDFDYNGGMQLYFTSFHSGPSSSMTMLDVVNSPSTAMGFASGTVTGISGKEGYLGAFEQAGNPEGLPKNAFIYAFTGVIVFTSDLPTIQDKYNQFGTIIGLPRWE